MELNNGLIGERNRAKIRGSQGGNGDVSVAKQVLNRIVMNDGGGDELAQIRSKEKVDDSSMRVSTHYTARTGSICAKSC